MWSLRHLLDLLVDLINVTLAQEDDSSILLMLMVAVADVGVEENVDDRQLGNNEKYKQQNEQNKTALGNKIVETRSCLVDHLI